jgi:hypothetical protein
MRAASLALLLVAAPTASADVFKLNAEVDGGGQAGKGVGGTQQDNSFFAKSPTLAYGAQIGAELFGLLDAWVQHHQYIGSGQLTTWTQFGAGLHFQAQLGTDVEQKAHTNLFFDGSVGFWFGFGTGAQVMPPLDNAQITDKGFLADVRLGVGKHVNSIVDVGVEVPVSYGYFFKNGNGIAANDTNNHYQGVQGEVLGYVRFGFKLL